MNHDRTALQPARHAMRRRISVLTILTLLAAFVAVMQARVSEAQPTGTFEITDGNIVDDGANPAPDWGSVFGPGGVTPSDTAAEAFVVDPLSHYDALPCTPGGFGGNTV